MRHLVACFALMTLAACGDPIADMPRLSEADIPEDSSSLSAVPAPLVETDEEGGFFSRLFGGSADTGVVPQSPAKEDGIQKVRSLPPESYGAASELPTSPKPRGGFLASLFSGGNDPVGSPGLTPEISRNTLLPYGKIAKVCGLSKSAMGRKVDQYPAKRSRHVLYDSRPGDTSPHSFYLTGFSDGCARQFTASVALFGSVEMHEQLRYGLPAEVQPYSDTDRAYEKLKSRVCGVGRKKPCGSRLRLLENDTVFLSIYEKFGGNERWSNLLLHGGQLLAQDVKG